MYAKGRGGIGDETDTVEVTPKRDHSVSAGTTHYFVPYYSVLISKPFWEKGGRGGLFLQ